MYGLNAVAFVLFGCMNILAYQLCKCTESRRRKILRTLCAVLLCGNLLRYGLVYPFLLGTVRIPVEFSTVAYFAVPLILLGTKRRLHSWAAYSGLMAGFFYYMAMLLAGGPLYHTYPPEDIYISMFCHGTLYVCGFTAVCTEAYSPKEASLLLLGVLLVAAWAALFRPMEAGRERMLIYILLDAAAVKQMLSQSVWALAVPAYYICLSGLIGLTVWGFFRLNRRQYRRFSADFA